MSEPTKILLDESEIPSHWYNVQADLERPIDPALHPGALQPAGPDDFAPLISLMAHLGLIEPRAYHQNAVFAAAVQFAQTECIIPAPEPAHAIKATIDETLACKESGEAKTILFHLCGHGHFDMSAYENYFTSGMVDYAYPEEEVARAMEFVPVIQ